MAFLSTKKKSLMNEHQKNYIIEDINYFVKISVGLGWPLHREKKKKRGFYGLARSRRYLWTRVLLIYLLETIVSMVSTSSSVFNFKYFIYYLSRFQIADQIEKQ